MPSYRTSVGKQTSHIALIACGEMLCKCAYLCVCSYVHVAACGNTVFPRNLELSLPSNCHHTFRQIIPINAAIDISPSISVDAAINI